MLRISARGNVIVVLAVSAAFLAQGDDVPDKSQNHSSVPDARQIMESSIAATQRHWQVRLRYTYTERDESRRRHGWAREVGGYRCLENDSGQWRSIRVTLGT